jgi:hypothetical protein
MPAGGGRPFSSPAKLRFVGEAQSWLRMAHRSGNNGLTVVAR